MAFYNGQKLNMLIRILVIKIIDEFEIKFSQEDGIYNNVINFKQ